jgi:hypothetical protein
VLYAANTGKTEGEAKRLVLLRIDVEFGRKKGEFLIHGRLKRLST